MINYTCSVCLKNFNQKYQYINHTKKNPCNNTINEIQILIDKKNEDKNEDKNDDILNINNIKSKKNEYIINNVNNMNNTINNNIQMNINNLRSDLINKCKELNISNYSTKNKNELVLMITKKIQDQKQNNDNIKTKIKTKISKIKIIKNKNKNKIMIQNNENVIDNMNENVNDNMNVNDNEIVNDNENMNENMNDNVNVIVNDNDNVNINNKKYKYIDLFCGIGGFHQALNKLDAQCVFACDINENCRSIYEKNYKIKPEGDITKINIKQIPSFDILCGGFPCQPFSKAGFQKGFDDDRGNLFFNICKIIKYHKPKYLLLENVKNLSSHDNGNTWNTIHKNIIDLGYNTYELPVILNVLHFNVPQNRERVIIMCKRKDLGELPKLPLIPKNPKSKLTQNIKNIINVNEKENNNKYKINGKMKDVESIWDNFIKLLILNKISIPKFPIWTDWWDNEITSNKPFYKKYKNWIDKNREFYNTNKELLKKWLDKSRECKNWIGAVRKFEWQAGDQLENDGMNNVLWTTRGSGIRVKRLDYIPTLVAMSMIPIYGPESRKLSPRELLRLQSFPDTFEYDEKTILKQIGNSVNVKMIEKVARFMIFSEPLF